MSSYHRYFHVTAEDQRKVEPIVNLSNQLWLRQSSFYLKRQQNNHQNMILCGLQ